MFDAIIDKFRDASAAESAGGGVKYALEQIGLPGLVICALLLVLSSFSVAVILTKLWSVRRARRKNRSFLHMFRGSRNPLALFESRGHVPGSPMSTVYMMGCQELSYHLLGSSEVDDSFNARLQGAGKVAPTELNAVVNTLERGAGEAARKLESTMNVLATAVSGAPFLGLLGTVWGVMQTFADVARAGGGATLGDLAPGVTAALLTTLVGLLVAIPAMFAYNYLAGGIRGLVSDLDNFGAELLSSLERSYVDHGRRFDSLPSLTALGTSTGPVSTSALTEVGADAAPVGSSAPVGAGGAPEIEPEVTGPADESDSTAAAGPPTEDLVEPGPLADEAISAAELAGGVVIGEVAEQGEEAAEQASETVDAEATGLGSEESFLDPEPEGDGPAAAGGGSAEPEFLEPPTVELTPPETPAPEPEVAPPAEAAKPLPRPTEPLSLIAAKRPEEEPEESEEEDGASPPPEPKPSSDEEVQASRPRIRVEGAPAPAPDPQIQIRVAPPGSNAVEIAPAGSAKPPPNEPSQTGPGVEAMRGFSIKQPSTPPSSPPAPEGAAEEGVVEPEGDSPAETNDEETV